MRQSVVVGQDFPGGVKVEAGLPAALGDTGIRTGFAIHREPGFKVLMNILLRLEVGNYYEDGPRWKKVVQDRGEKGMPRRTDAGTNQCAARLHAPSQRLHGGSLGSGGNHAGRIG